MRIQGFAEKGQVRQALDVCTEMKKNGVRPNRQTYSWLLHALSDRYMMHEECWAAFYDMKALGIEPDVQLFNHLLRVRMFPSRRCVVA